jgi:osmotically-inducible protein OsmY
MLPLFFGMIAFASMRSSVSGSTTDAFAEQDTNKNASTTGTKPRSTKVDCSMVDDAALAAQIKMRHSKKSSLKNEKDIKIDVKDGVATLSGSVSSRSHRNTAVAEAKKVKCVKSVINNINSKCPGCTEFCCDGVCQSTQCAEKPKKP